MAVSQDLRNMFPSLPNYDNPQSWLTAKNLGIVENMYGKILGRKPQGDEYSDAAYISNLGVEAGISAIAKALGQRPMQNTADQAAQQAYLKRQLSSQSVAPAPKPAAPVNPPAPVISVPVNPPSPVGGSGPVYNQPSIPAGLIQSQMAPYMESYQKQLADLQNQQQAFESQKSSFAGVQKSYEDQLSAFKNQLAGLEQQKAQFQTQIGQQKTSYEQQLADLMKQREAQTLRSTELEKQLLGRQTTLDQKQGEYESYMQGQIKQRDAEERDAKLATLGKKMSAFPEMQGVKLAAADVDKPLIAPFRPDNTTPGVNGFTPVNPFTAPTGPNDFGYLQQQFDLKGPQYENYSPSQKLTNTENLFGQKAQFSRRPSESFQEWASRIQGRGLIQGQMGN
jgi:hypothetical protein